MLLHIGRGMKLDDGTWTYKADEKNKASWPSTAGYRGFHVGLVQTKPSSTMPKKTTKQYHFGPLSSLFEGECHFSLVQRSHTFLQPQKNRRQIAVSRLAVSANSAAQSVPMATHPFLGLDHLEPFPAASTVMWLKQCHKPPILGNGGLYHL